MERHLTLQAEREGVRVDKYVAEAVPDLSRAAVQRLIGEGLVLVNGDAVKASYRLVAILPQPLPP